jgi:hypothetical protein
MLLFAVTSASAYLTHSEIFSFFQVVEDELHEHLVTHKLSDSVLVYGVGIGIIETIFDLIFVLGKKFGFKRILVVHEEGDL